MCFAIALVFVFTFYKKKKNKLRLRKTHHASRVNALIKYKMNACRNNFFLKSVYVSNFAIKIVFIALHIFYYMQIVNNLFANILI